MLNMITNIPKVLKKFLDRFKEQLYKPQFKSFCHYIAGLLMIHKRCSIESIAKLCPDINYENLQYFISESNFDVNDINNTRLNLLNRLHPTKTTKQGLIVVDDTSCKKYGKHTEGAKVQYCSTEEKVTNCNTTVLLGYCDNIKRYPLGMKPYKPLDEFNPEDAGNFKSKLELALGLIDEAYNNKELEFSHTVFDSWYFANDFVNELSSKNRFWITECQIDRKITFQGQNLRAEELVKVLPALKFKKAVSFINSKGKKRIFYLAEVIVQIKGVKEQVKLCVAKGSWDENDTKGIHIFVTNHLSLNTEEIFSKYSMRWGIECMFRDLKDNLGFDQYQTRSLKAITRHWHFSFVAYSFLIYAKLNAVFSKMVSTALNTIGDLASAFRSINTHCAQDWINKHKEKFYAFLHIKEPKMA